MKRPTKAQTALAKGEIRKQTHATEPSRADLIVQNLCGKSRSEVRALFQLGNVTKNGRACTEPGTVLAEGDTIELRFDPQRRYREEKRSYSSRLFDVVFEDNYLIVVDKQAGFLTSPTENEDRQSLLASVNKYISVKGGRQAGATLVHRLDRDTSGLLVLAKHTNLAQTIKEQFKERKPKREYVAIVAGNVARTKGTFRSFLATDEDLNQYSTKDEDEGKLAVTHYTVIRRFPSCTYVRVQLETGRRNQIRVHFSEKGHPVIGDVRYRAKQAQHPLWPYRRLALHATELGFRHPVTKRELHFTSPLPKEFKEFLGKIKNEKPGREPPQAREKDLNAPKERRRFQDAPTRKDARPTKVGDRKNSTKKTGSKKTFRHVRENVDEKEKVQKNERRGSKRISRRHGSRT